MKATLTKPLAACVVVLGVISFALALGSWVGEIRRHTTPQRYFGLSFSVSPDGEAIVFSGGPDGSDNIYLLNLQTSRVSQLTHGGYNCDPAFLPDSSGIVWARTFDLRKPTHLFRMCFGSDAEPVPQLKSIRQLTFGETVSDTSPLVSPNGQYVVFTRAADYVAGRRSERPWKRFDLFAVDVQAVNVSRLTFTNTDNATPECFSPDGKTLLYWACRGENKGLFSATCNGGFTISVPREMKADNAGDADFSADGRRIVFGAKARSSYGYDLFTMDISDFGKPNPIVDPLDIAPITGGDNGSPKFLRPAGKAVFFLQGFYSGLTLWKVGADGKNARQFASTKLFDDPLHWKAGE